MTVTDLPTNVSYCTVTGRFLAVVDDTSDVGQEPNGVAMVGQIRFKPTPAYLINVNATPVPLFMFPLTITAQIDTSGYLTNPVGTERSVKLLAPDDPDLVAYDADDQQLLSWGYEVEFAFVGGPGARAVPRTIFLTPGAGTTVDLTGGIATLVILDGGSFSDPRTRIIDGGTL